MLIVFCWEGFCDSSGVVLRKNQAGFGLRALDPVSNVWLVVLGFFCGTSQDDMPETQLLALFMQLIGTSFGSKKIDQGSPKPM